MEIIDERKRQKIKDRKKQSSGASYSESVRAKWFCCEFKLGLVQLLCKLSLIFKLNLELPWSIIFKKRELYESKYIEVECRCLKICDFLYLLICTSFVNVATAAASRNELILPVKISNHQELGLYMKNSF